MARISSSPASAGDRRSPCPVASALDLFGDRWTLLIIRDLFAGKQRYGEFIDSPEGIPSNVLAERLQRLEAADLVTSTPYQNNPPRYAYTLTPKGTALKPVLGGIARWGLRHLPGTKLSEGMTGMLPG